MLFFQRFLRFKLTAVGDFFVLFVVIVFFFFVFFLFLFLFLFFFL